MNKPLKNDTKSVKYVEKRTTLTVDQDTKLVFDWAMKNSNAKNVPKYLQHLLLLEQEENGQDEGLKTWNQLLNRARSEKQVCEKHGKPLVYICDCGDKLCADCDVEMHISRGHVVQNYCRIHNTGYGETCLMCEKERWENVVDVEGVTARQLMDLLDSDINLAIIDVRDINEWDVGHLPETYKTHNEYLKIFAYREFVKQKEMKEEFAAIKKFLGEHKTSQFVVISQSNKQNIPDEQKESGRGYLVAAHMKCLFGVDDVRYLRGGWFAFHEQYPSVVEVNHPDVECHTNDQGMNHN